MRYALGCAFNIDDLFINFPNNKLHVTGKQCLKICHQEHKKVLLRKVFKESLKIILKDIIENNNTFELPTGAKKADIHVDKIEGDDFWKACRHGAFKKIDYLKSFFTGYMLSFFMYSNNRTRTKRIYVDKTLKSILEENTNKGKLYC